MQITFPAFDGWFNHKNGKTLNISKKQKCLHIAAPKQLFQFFWEGGDLCLGFVTKGVMPIKTKDLWIKWILNAASERPKQIVKYYFIYVYIFNIGMRR